MLCRSCTRIYHMYVCVGIMSNHILVLGGFYERVCSEMCQDVQPVCDVTQTISCPGSAGNSDMDDEIPFLVFCTM